MSKRKIVSEIASGSNGELIANDTVLNNFFGDTKDEIVGRLEMGSTMLDITKALDIVKQKKDGDSLFKYTIMLYITRSAANNAAQFIEIESPLIKTKILDIMFEHLKYKLPGGKKLNKRKRDGVFCARKYFGEEDDFFFLQISEDHAFIYIGDSDGKHYKNNFSSVMNFVYRKDPTKKPTLCSIM